MRFICTMKRIMIVFLLVLLSGVIPVSAQVDQFPQAKKPILLSSAGQSPGATMLKLLLTRSSIPFDYLQVATLDQFQSEPYNTLVLALGTSLKGMGAAGIDFDSEVDRIQNLIDYAKSEGILVLGFHIEGESRRGGYDEELIEKFIHQLDGLVIRKDGNADGIFTDITEENNIPRIEIEKTIELGSLLKEIFK